MSSQFRVLPLLIVALLFALPGASARAQQGQEGEMVDNPHYQYWRAHKPGCVVIQQETTKVSAQDADPSMPDGLDQKRIVSKLISADDRRVIIETVVTERVPLGFVQDAPTRRIYPAKVRKQDLERHMQMTGEQTGEEVLKVQDKEVRVKTKSGTIKTPDGDEIQYKVWLSDDVPGAIVKTVRTTRQGGNVVAETTDTVESFEKEPAAGGARP